jgi:hypothetical protein
MRTASKYFFGIVFGVGFALMLTQCAMDVFAR